MWTVHCFSRFCLIRNEYIISYSLYQKLLAWRKHQFASPPSYRVPLRCQHCCQLVTQLSDMLLITWECNVDYVVTPSATTCMPKWQQRTVTWNRSTLQCCHVTEGGKIYVTVVHLLQISWFKLWRFSLAVGWRPVRISTRALHFVVFISLFNHTLK